MKKMLKTLFCSLNPLKAKKISSEKINHIFSILILLAIVLSIAQSILYWRELSPLIINEDYSIKVVPEIKKLVSTKNWLIIPDDFNKSDLEIDNKNILNSSTLIIKDPFCLLNNCFKEIDLEDVIHSESFHTFLRNNYILFSFGYVILSTGIILLKLIIISLVAFSSLWIYTKITRTWVKLSKLYKVSLAYLSIILIGRIINLFRETFFVEYLFYAIFLILSVKTLSNKRKNVTIKEKDFISKKGFKKNKKRNKRKVLRNK